MNRSFYITDNFTKEEYDLLAIDQELSKITTVDYAPSLELKTSITKYKHKNKILTKYSSYIINGTGSTTALFYGKYDKLFETRKYSFDFYHNIVFSDKIIKQKELYYYNWRYIDTNEIWTKEFVNKEQYDKQQFKLRYKKLKRILKKIN